VLEVGVNIDGNAIKLSQPARNKRPTPKVAPPPNQAASSKATKLASSVIKKKQSLNKKRQRAPTFDQSDTQLSVVHSVASQESVPQEQLGSRLESQLSTPQAHRLIGQKDSAIPIDSSPSNSYTLKAKQVKEVKVDFDPTIKAATSY